MRDILTFQTSFRPPLPEIYGCADYREQRDLLIRIDELINQTNADSKFQKLCLDQFDRWKSAQEQNGDGDTQWTPPYNPYTDTGKIKQSWLHDTQTAFRANILRFLTDRSLRGMSFQMSDSELTKWFCHINEFAVKSPSKSTVDRYEDWIDSESLRGLITDIIQQAGGISKGGEINAIEISKNPLNLEQAIDLSEAWWDGFCLKANIHYPTDWVLLRDICRTLILAVILIRKRGLKNRMPQAPHVFMRDMNKLVIEMTQSTRKKGAKKTRKHVLRKMVKLEKKIAKHAESHRDILIARRIETDLSERSGQQIIDRINGVLKKLPAAIEQARERIIGERAVSNDGKILSIYESDINVIVRGKADARVEFGNVFRIAELKSGLIIDFKLYKESVADNSPIPFREGIERMEKATAGNLAAVWTDRGMDSKENVAVLDGKGIKNGICPKSPEKLHEKMLDPAFAEGQKRRASTEGRIGIFQNRILGGELRTKGFHGRELSVAWAVLSHNFWVLARLPQKEVSGRKSTDQAAPPIKMAA